MTIHLLRLDMIIKVDDADVSDWFMSARTDDPPRIYNNMFLGRQNGSVAVWFNSGQLVV